MIESPELKITDLRPAIKSENRVNIFINGEYDFSLDISQVIDLKIKVGRILTPEELENCRSASEFGKLYQSTLEWVLSRPHSVRETRDHLQQKLLRRKTQNKIREANDERQIPLFTKEMIEQVISRLLEKGYLDDEKFAKYYVENRFQKKGISYKRLEQELLKKGLDSRVILSALETSDRNESDELKKQIAKKSKKYTEDKLIQYLLRQGFSYDAIKSAIAEQKAED